MGQPHHQARCPEPNVGAVALGDTYTSIEGVYGGAGNDTVYGDGVGNHLLGQGGTDVLLGLADNDTLDGGAGTDYLYGGAGADIHNGGAGSDIDYVRYDDASWGNLTIRLDNAALNVGAVAMGDTYVSIEGVFGGAGSDTVYGNGVGNHLFSARAAPTSFWALRATTRSMAGRAPTTSMAGPGPMPQRRGGQQHRLCPLRRGELWQSDHPAR